MEIRTLSEKRNRWIRLSFTRFLVERYGMNLQTAYGKLHKARIQKWEVMGIVKCILAHSPDYSGEPADFFSQTESKIRFCTFMESECGMSAKTAFVRFRSFDFSAIELKGFDVAYEEFLEHQKLEV